MSTITFLFFFFFQAEDGIRDKLVTGVQTCALPISVVIKRFKPQQDRRFDLPAIGPGTIRAMADCGAAVLAIEAGRAVFLDREEAIAAADEAGIAIVGVTGESVKR